MILLKNFTKTTLLTALSMGISLAEAAMYPLMPNTDVVGDVTVTTARYEDSFITLAKKHDIGFLELQQANLHLDPWVPGEGSIVTLPARYVLPPRDQRKGIVINLAELRLYYFPTSGDRVYTYPIGVGRMNWKTPVGKHTITQKLENAPWYPPDSIRQEGLAEGRVYPAFIPAGPDNPMGYHKMRLSDPNYLIHGTNREGGIGRRVSHGCINMYNDDVKELYAITPVGTPVSIVHEPYKAGWKDGYLWLEAHQPLEDYRTAINDYTVNTMINITEKATNNLPAELDWSLAKNFYANGHGIPMVIGSLKGSEQHLAAK